MYLFDHFLNLKALEIILKFGQYIRYKYERNLSAKIVDTCIITTGIGIQTKRM